MGSFQPSSLIFHLKDLGLKINWDLHCSNVNWLLKKQLTFKKFTFSCHLEDQRKSKKCAGNICSVNSMPLLIGGMVTDPDVVEESTRFSPCSHIENQSK